MSSHDTTLSHTVPIGSSFPEFSYKLHTRDTGYKTRGQNTQQRLGCAIELMNEWLCPFVGTGIQILKQHSAIHCKYTTIKHGIFVFALLFFGYYKSKATVEPKLNGAFCLNMQSSVLCAM